MVAEWCPTFIMSSFISILTEIIRFHNSDNAALCIEAKGKLPRERYVLSKFNSVLHPGRHIVNVMR